MRRTDPDDAPWVVVGLGNPGDRYARTRHNVGRFVTDRLAARHGGRFRKVRFTSLEVAETHLGPGGPRVLFVHPLSYMNLSGPPVAGYVKRVGAPLDRLVVCHDEIDLPFGTLRLKQGGSSGGHRGLESLTGALRSPDYHRVRVGVGRPPGRQDPADFVLEPFARRELEEVELLVEDAADAVEALVERGLPFAQDRFNRTAPR